MVYRLLPVPAAASRVRPGATAGEQGRDCGRRIHLESGDAITIREDGSKRLVLCNQCVQQREPGGRRGAGEFRGRLRGQRPPCRGREGQVVPGAALCEPRPAPATPAGSAECDARALFSRVRRKRSAWRPACRIPATGRAVPRPTVPPSGSGTRSRRWRSGAPGSAGWSRRHRKPRSAAALGGGLMIPFACGRAAPVAAPGGLSLPRPCATLHRMTAPIRCRTLPAVAALVVQTGSRTAMTSSVSRTRDAAPSRLTAQSGQAEPTPGRGPAAVVPCRLEDCDDRPGGCQPAMPGTAPWPLKAGRRRRTALGLAAAPPSAGGASAARRAS